MLGEEGDQIVIEWSFPGTEENTNFSVEILAQDREWYEVTDACDYSFASDSGLYSCGVLIETLLDPPFNLLYNDSIYSRVTQLGPDG